MTSPESAERTARAIRQEEQIRAEERKRAYDIIEMAAYNKPDEVAVALWEVAARIMLTKPPR